MRLAPAILLWIYLTAFPCRAWSQETAGNDNPSSTESLGVPMTIGLAPTGHYVGFGWGVHADAGYNFNRHHAILGEFNWNWLFPTDQSLRPIQLALQTNQVNGHGNLFALTSEYRFELRGKTLGTYLIAGGGFYYRSAGLHKPVPQGTPVGCTPVWVWWGYDCSTDPVISNSTVLHSTSMAPGVNGGIGFTFRVGEAPYRMYVESRYHFAPTKNITTQLIMVTWGVRY